jgi:hypothetical protein
MKKVRHVAYTLLLAVTLLAGNQLIAAQLANVVREVGPGVAVGGPTPTPTPAPPNGGCRDGHCGV